MVTSTYGTILDDGINVMGGGTVVPGTGTDFGAPPFVPGDWTVAQVEEYVGLNPGAAQDVYDAEVLGSNRSTLLSWLLNNGATA